MSYRLKDEDKSLGIQKAKVKLSEYPDKMFMDGFFNPICPVGFNYITGRTEDTLPANHGLSEYTVTARMNGTATYKN